MFTRIGGTYNNIDYNMIWATGNEFQVTERGIEAGFHSGVSLEFITILSMAQFNDSLAHPKKTIVVNDSDLKYIDLSNTADAMREYICLFSTGDEPAPVNSILHLTNFSFDGEKVSLNCFAVYLVSILEDKYIQLDKSVPSGKNQKQIQSYYINKDLIFKNRNLKEKKCKIISTIERRGINNSSLIMVEFEDFINGGNGDGLGKDGHCIIIKKDLIIKETKILNTQQQIF